MSSTATPIDPRRFAEAITALPLSNLHFKATEIWNSISHLRSSNEQLKEFADEGDLDCTETVRENLGVIERMDERIELLKMEVERRGFMWGWEGEGGENRIEGGGEGSDTAVNGEIHGNDRGVEVPRIGREGLEPNNHNGEGDRGRLGDEDSARRWRERMEEPEFEEADDGMHL
ncbi:hypothetical protein MMC12_002673 [Toensbergia leucococca]|nr:hypothetical protein [Toensbergia leucococca]